MHNSIQTETKNATSCNNRDDLLHLYFTFQYILRPAYNQA